MVGAHVFLAGRTAEPMEETKRAIEQQGGSASVMTADVRDPLQVEQIVATAVKQTGRLDIMVNNAGLEFPSTILDGKPEEWRAMLEPMFSRYLSGVRRR